MNKDFLTKRYALPALVSVGLFLAALLVMLKPEPAHQSAAVRVTPVEVFEARMLPVRARAVGYGEVHPSTFLKANAEVSGRIVFIHPELKRGEILAEGTVVLRIDATSYELAVAQARADLAANRANLEELEVEKSNIDSSLAIARRSLVIGEKELARKKKLLKQGAVSRSAADAEEQDVLRLRQEVQSLQSQLSLIPSRSQVAVAQIARAQAQVRDSEHSLSRTEIRLPFSARVGEVYVEEGQFAAVSSPLFDVGSVEQVEIAVELPVLHAGPIVRGLRLGGDGSARIDSDTLALLGLEARVSLVGGEPQAQWLGQVVRVGDSLDPVSRTVSFVVAVDNPYQQLVPGIRPPLIGGMYTRVELLARAAQAMVVPRRALHEGRVYVASNEQLEIRQVEVDFHVGELSVIRAGLNPGEQVIVTDVIPALAGMPLRVTTATALQDRLPSLALGEEVAP